MCLFCGFFANTWLKYFLPSTFSLPHIQMAHAGRCGRQRQCSVVTININEIADASRSIEPRPTADRCHRRRRRPQQHQRRRPQDRRTRGRFGRCDSAATRKRISRRAQEIRHLSEVSVEHKIPGESSHRQPRRL